MHFRSNARYQTDPYVLCHILLIHHLPPLLDIKGNTVIFYRQDQCFRSDGYTHLDTVLLIICGKTVLYNISRYLLKEEAGIECPSLIDTSFLTELLQSI